MSETPLYRTTPSGRMERETAYCHQCAQKVPVMQRKSRPHTMGLFLSGFVLVGLPWLLMPFALEEWVCEQCGAKL
jgi:hypothetical protein